MKIALLSRNRRLYSTRRLIEAAEERGHETIVGKVVAETGVPMRCR